MSDSSATAAASRLCRACGLCCTGVMFHLVRLQPGDSAQALVAAGLRVRRKKGHDYFVQPCSAYREGQCSIYLQRPERCRRFECRQLQRVASGEITEAAALGKIEDVLRRVAHLDELSLRADGSRRKGPLSQRAATELAEPFDAAEDPQRTLDQQALKRGMSELEAVLDADFRVAAAAPVVGTADDAVVCEHGPVDGAFTNATP